MAREHSASARLLSTLRSHRSDDAGQRGRVRFRRLLHEALEVRTVLDAAPFELPPQYYLTNPDGFLTGPADGDPLDIARSYLVAHAPDLGLSAADLEGMKVTDRYVSDQTQATHLYLRQVVAGLEVAQADLSVHVAPAGQIISVGGGFVPGLTELVANGQIVLEPTLTAEEAAQRAAASLGVVLDGEPAMVHMAEDGMSCVIAAPGLSLDDVSARLHLVPSSYGTAALSWQLIVRTPDNQHWYDLSVDAHAGHVTSQIDWSNDASYNVLPIPTESPNFGSFQIVVDPHLASPVASPFGWHDTNGSPGAESTLTIGNNVDAHLDRDGNNVADAGGRPDGGPGLNFNFTFDPALTPLQNANAAVTNLFYWNNVLHDVHYVYGFTPAAGNFQTNNYGQGGLGNDAVQADAQDNANGGSVNNANMAVPPDGTAPRMQMYEFALTSPRRDSDIDPGIIIHEYGHGVSVRLTGGPANSGSLSALQSGGMGEGWSDWWSLMLTQRLASETTTGRGMGTYVLGQPPGGSGIRQFRYDFDIGNQAFETFLNFPINTQVHNVGTRWAATLWDLNHLLIQKYGFEPNVYNSTSLAGNIRALHLVSNALKLQPSNPSFLQARDAILAADNLLYGGANHFEIWTAFARRGLGFGASTPSSNSSSLTTSFALPPQFQGLQVTSSNPAGGSIVTTQPTSFVINFNNPVAPASVQPTDLLVNGVPATSVALSSGNQTATFTYAVSPVVNQGQQTMSIAADTILRASDNDGINDFVANFRYDATLLNVVSTTPPPGGVFTLSGPLTYDVTFNEAVGPSSVQASDLSLSGIPGATVSGVTIQPGGTTLRFTITGAASEGTLTASIAAGAINDAFGNPGAAFTANYLTDLGTVAYPVPLAPLSPDGSLIYDPSASGVINAAGDIDSFSIHIDPGQTISVVVDPSDPSAAALYGGVGNGSGSAAGRLLLVSQATGAGTIIADPVTPGGITGLALDPASGVLFGTTMQNAGDFSSLVRIDPATGALLGTVGVITDGPAPMSIGDLAIHPVTGTLYGIRSNGDGANLGGRLYTINKSTGAATLVGNANSGSGGGIAFAPDGTLYQTAHNAPGGSFSLNRLNPANAARLSSVPLQFYFDGLAVRPSDGALFAATGGSGDQIFTINPATGAATLVGATGAGSTSDLAFAAATDALAPVVELRDPAGALLGSASAGPALNALLQTVATTTGGNYSIAVRGDSGTTGAYTVKVTLNAALEEEGVLDGESNDTRATAQNINDSFIDLNPQGGTADRGAVTGHVTGAANLIANGDFETGNLNGWTVFTANPNLGSWEINNGTINPPSPANPQPPISGSFDVFSNPTGPAIKSITQSFVVPQIVNQATLSWSDRIQSFAPLADPIQEFRVQILSGSTVLATVFSTSPSDPAIQLGPNSRSFDLTSLLQPRAGQTLQLRFEQQDNSFFMNVTLDNIALTVGQSSSAGDEDFFAVDLEAGVPIQVAMALPGFIPGAMSFSGTRTDIVTTPGLPGQSGTIPLEVAYRDLNGDGKLDMVSANGGASTGPNAAGSIGVRFGNGDGTFGSSTLYPTGGLFTRFLDFGDTNGDGRLDIVASNDDSNTVSLLLGNGNGTFAAATTYPVGPDPLGVSVGDLNGDGRDDVVVPHFNNGAVGVLLGQAGGTLSPVTFFGVNGGAPFTTDLGDVNGDGRLDVVTANFNSASMSVLLGNGTGGFAAPIALGGQGSQPWGIALADLNGDGRLDAITGNQGSGNISVRLGTGASPFFGAPTFFTVGGGGPRTVALGDVNRDGKLDVAVPRIGAADAAILLGNGNGTFAAPQFFSTGPNPNYATLDDLNGDGFDDLSTANAGTSGIGSISVRLNTTPSIQLQLQDAAGNVVATGSHGPTNYDSGLSYVPPAGGTYYVRVGGNTAADYNLVITRNAAFDTEANDSPATAQDLTGLEGALGAISGAGGSALYATGGDGTRLIRINTATGVATDIGPFGTSQTWATAFTPDGTMWTMVNGFNPSTVRLATVNQATGTTTAVGSATNWTGSPVIALEADAEGNLYGASFSGTLFNINQSTGLMTPIGQLGFFNVMDLAFDQTGGLWGLDGGNVLFRINPATGQGTFQSVISGVNGAVMGLMIDPVDNAMYATTYTTNSPLYRVNPTTGAATQIGAGLGVPVPHGGDFLLLGDFDVYEISVTAGSPITFVSRTPADGPGEFVNTLDPQLELLDPSGAVVATGTALADGRNERISYQALVTGTYRLRVSSEGSTGGEYYISRNVAPVLADVTVTSPVDEGDVATLTGTVVDPDTLDSHTVVINWGPGEGTTILELAAGVSTFTATHQYRDDNPTGTPSDTYLLSVTVTDSQGDSTSLGTSTTVETTTDLVVNGGFETGDFAGWQVTATTGGWQINDGSVDPPGPGTALSPISGSFDALTVQTGAGQRILSEPIVVPADIISATLSWSDRIRNFATQFADPNQEFRVLILDGAGNLLEEIFSTNPGDPLQQAGPNNRSRDATSLLQSRAGQTIRLSFQEEDSLGFFNVTLDDIHLLVTTSETIETPPLSVVVNNVAPDIAPIASVAIDEGQSVTVSGTFSDPALGVPSESFTGTAVWSDGVSTPLAINAVTGAFSTTRSFADDNPTGTPQDALTVSISIADDDGGSDSAPANVTVRNVAPQIGAVVLSAAAIDEGQSVTVSGAFSDPALGVATESFTGSALWSDGVTTLLTIDSAAGTFTTTRSFPDDDPTGTPADTFTVTISIADDDGGSDSATSPLLTVRNVAPSSVSLSTSSPINESDTLTLSGTFADPGVQDTFTVVIDWGPGETSTTLTLAAGVTNFTASHQYADDNPTGTASDVYAIKVTITDDDGGTVTAQTEATVVNLAPDLGALSSDATPLDLGAVGQPVSVAAAFTDVGLMDTHAASFDWGDGSSSAGSVAGGSAGGSHAYAAGGIYTITLTLADDDTDANSATATAYVTGVGVVGGQLQIIGTNADDLVHVNLAEDAASVIRVHASFLPPNPGYIDVPSAGVTSILVMLFDGNDQAQLAGNVRLPAILDGGGGSDHLNAGGGAAVLIGGLGDDFLQGSGAGAILIGGLGADSLLGGSLEDVLIGGTTSFDADQEALFALLAEWTSARDFQTRIANLRTGEGPILDGRKLEKGTTVFDDGDADALNGAAALDWFFYLLGEDTINGSTKGSLN